MRRRNRLFPTGQRLTQKIRECEAELDALHIHRQKIASRGAELKDLTPPSAGGFQLAHALDHAMLDQMAQSHADTGGIEAGVLDDLGAGGGAPPVKDAQDVTQPLTGYFQPISLRKADKRA